MENITFTLGDMAYLIALVTAIITLYFLIKKIFKPIIDMGKKLDNDFKKLKEHEDRLNTIDSDISEIKKMLKILCYHSISTMNHMIDGNGIEEMKETRDKAMRVLSKEEAL